MKKLYLIALISVMAAVLVIAGCSNVFSPSLTQGGGNGNSNGNVTVSLSGGTFGKIVLPSTLDFDLYEFTFTNVSSGYDETFPAGKSAGGMFAFSVPPGPGYVLNIKAYKGTGEGKIEAAKGVSSEFTVGSSTSVTVKLTGNYSEGNGTFSYTIQFPAGAQVDRMVLVIGEDEEDLLAGANESQGQDVYTISNSVDVQAGWYWLELELSDGDKEFFGGDLVSIYSNTTSFYGTTSAPVVITAKNFKGENTGIQVDEWHGFNVAGWSHYFTSENGNFGSRNYDPSRAEGYHIETFTDGNGDTWADVLKLQPPQTNDPADYGKFDWGIPDGFYQNWTMAMTYPLYEAGTYHVSGSVWVDKPASTVTTFLWHNTGGLGGDAYPAWGSKTYELSGGRWYDFSFEVPSDLGRSALQDNDELGILAKHLGNAAMYLRGLKVVAGEGGDPGEPDPGTELYLNTESFTLVQGRTRTITANKTAEWSVSPAGVVTIEGSGDGLSAVVTAVSTGAATVTAVSLDDPEERATVSVTVIAGGSRYIALSFDDGPNPSYSRSVMSIMEDYGAHATFMCIGGNVRGNPAIAREMIANGHEIGNHTYNHTMMLQMEALPIVINELQETKNAIYEVTGTMPVLFRAPALLYHTPFLHSTSDPFPDLEVQYGGNYEEACRQLGMSPIDGSGHQNGNYDWDGRSAQAIFETAKGLAKDWGVLLLHDSNGNTEAALPMILDWLQGEGYEVLTVSELAAKRKAAAGLSPASDLEPGRIYYDFISMPEHITGITVKNGGVEITEPVFMEVNDTFNLTATVQPAGAQPVYWYSANENVVTINASGVVTARGNGTTVIRVASGGMRKLVTVTVGPRQEEWAALTSWDDMEYPTEELKPGGAWVSPANGAAYDVLDDFTHGDGSSYDNVLKIFPEGDDYLNIQGSAGSMVLVYKAPFDGIYNLSMEVWVENTPNAVDLVWYECISGWNQFIDKHGVAKDTWVPLEGTTYRIAAGSYLGLLGKNYIGALGLRGATIYIKNLLLTVTLDSGETVTVVDIDSAAIPAVPNDNPGVTIEWDEGEVPLTVSVSGGSIVSQNPVTVTRGSTVTIAAPSGFTSYKWLIGREEVSTVNTCTFTATEDSYKILLWVNNGDKGASVSIVVE